MMVEPHPAVRVIRNVRENVVLRNLDRFVGDLLRMDEADLIDRFLHRDDDGARQPVQITASHKTHR